MTTSATLLVELLTEELPPKTLKSLSEAFAKAITEGLREHDFLDAQSVSTTFATPRRLGVAITHVLAVGPDKPFKEKLLPVGVAFDASGKPTPALLGKLKAKQLTHVDPSTLEREHDGKTEVLYYSDIAKGGPLVNALQTALDDAIGSLPIAKVMSYASGGYFNDQKFVRPARGLIALHGRDVVPVTALGLRAGSTTGGHRFLVRRDIEIKSADAYEPTLEAEGKVVPSFAKRRAQIKLQLTEIEADIARYRRETPVGRVPFGSHDVRIDLELTPGLHQGQLFPATVDLEAINRARAFGGGEVLLDEVTALVESPKIYWGKFDETFLALPQECLALSMKQHQKYFPVFDTSAQLLPYFAVVSNLDVVESGAIVAGNERVIRPRLADAKFFFDQDRKQTLAARVPKLAAVVYHNKIGSQLLRTYVIQDLAGKLAQALDFDKQTTERAALLSKADLLTDMVAEFPQLQGLMGRYYALADGESTIVANAIEQHYLPRFAGDRLPEGRVAIAVALADKLVTLIWLFNIGLVPTGEKDRFGLRRQAFGVVRILIEREFVLSLDELFALGAAAVLNDANSEKALIPLKPPPGQSGGTAYASFQLKSDTLANLQEFLYDRLRSYLHDLGFQWDEIESVVSQRPTRLDLVLPRLEAVRAFRTLPEAQALAAANKRIGNILRAAPSHEILEYLDPFPGLSKEVAEKRLFDTLVKLGVDIDTLLDNVQDESRFTKALTKLANIKDSVDAFFDRVMVMTDNKEERFNRLAMLAKAHRLMNRVADISKLAA